MPRIARKKNPNYIYHIMCRSISEVNLFKEAEDKEEYLTILKAYQQMFAFKVYAYCIMDNHCHFIIDVNGADISRIFHGINFKYAHYYNKKYKRHGHLFQDRFKSKIIDNDRYLITLSAYIHGNPFSIEEYCDKVEEYEYSSLGIYLGVKKDKFQIIEKEYLLSYFNVEKSSAKKVYLDIVKRCTSNRVKSEIEFDSEGTRYVSERKVLYRDCSVEKIVDFLKNKINVSELTLMMKNCKKTVEQRAIFTLFVKCFCNYRNKDICSVIGNLTQSRVSTLCHIGMELISSKEKYKNLVPEFIKLSAT